MKDRIKNKDEFVIINKFKENGEGATQQVIFTSNNN